MSEGSSATEEALPAGRITRGVVRVGDTVRRPSKPSSPFMARLLTRLEQASCEWAPRYLGQDEEGRDVLSYVPGAVPSKWVLFSDAQIREAALIVRQLHVLTRGSDLAGGRVVCHNDPGPNNFVFRADVPVALIDFDMAAVGDPLEDLGYMAWSWCISSNSTRGPVAAQAAQVRRLANAYGLVAADRERLTDHIVERQLRNVAFWSEQLAQPDGTMLSDAQIAKIIAWSERELIYTQSHRAIFAAALED